jgi:hypothetical protein
MFDPLNSTLKHEVSWGDVQVRICAWSPKIPFIESQTFLFILDNC